VARAHSERCQECKKNVRNLLSELFGAVEDNFDLDLPASLLGYRETSSYDSLARIYSTLQHYRGFADFVRSKKLQRADFFIPNRALIVEFDESQHFTAPRGIALSQYPKEHMFGFSLEKWRELCLTHDKRDNDPPFRDEQRAWYDTLRDFAPIFWGKGHTIRLYARDLAWCSLNPHNNNDVKQFEQIIAFRET